MNVDQARSDSTALRGAVAGLVWFAAGEEALLLGGTDDDRDGTPVRWSAAATVAHNSDFRREQVDRLTAMRSQETPPEYPHIDHQDPEEYARLAANTRRHALDQSRSTTIALLDNFAATSDEDLLDPSRHPWLRGRMLWLQIVVRGFWHPLGHAGEYYAGHDRLDRALALHTHAVDAARYLQAPSPALGMACYSLACTQAVCGRPEEALGTLAEAISLNQDLRRKAAGEPDLDPLRGGGRLDQILVQS